MKLTLILILVISLEPGWNKVEDGSGTITGIALQICMSFNALFILTTLILPHKPKSIFITILVFSFIWVIQMESFLNHSTRYFDKNDCLYVLIVSLYLTISGQVKSKGFFFYILLDLLAMGSIFDLFQFNVSQNVRCIKKCISIDFLKAEKVRAKQNF